MNDHQPYEGHTTKLPGATKPATQTYNQPTYTLPTGGATPAQPYDLPHTTGATPPASQSRGQNSRRWGGLLVLSGVLLLGTASGRSFGLPILGGLVEHTVTVSNTYDSRRLVLNATAGNVTLVRGDANTITIEETHHGFGWTRATARRKAEEFQPQVSQSGDTIELTEPGWNSGLFSRDPYSDYRVTMPANVEVRVKTGKGNIEGSALAGPLELRSGSGNVRLSEIDGKLTINVGSGSVTVAESSLSEVQIKSGSGDIQIDGVQGPLSASTGSGSISVANVRDTLLTLTTGSGDIKVSDAEDATLALKTGSGSINFAGSLGDSGAHSAMTASGNLSLTLPDDASFQLEAQTSFGGIDLPRDWNVSGQDKSRSGKVGRGGPTLQLNTSSGDIQIKHQ